MWVSVCGRLVLVLEIKVRTLPESKKNEMHGRTDRDVLFCRCSLRNFVSPLFLPPLNFLPSEKPTNFIYNGAGRDLVIQQPIWDDSVLPQQI